MAERAMAAMEEEEAEVCVACCLSCSATSRSSISRCATVHAEIHVQDVRAVASRRKLVSQPSCFTQPAHVSTSPSSFLSSSHHHRSSSALSALEAWRHSNTRSSLFFVFTNSTKEHGAGSRPLQACEAASSPLFCLTRGSRRPVSPSAEWARLCWKRGRVRGQAWRGGTSCGSCGRATWTGQVSCTQS